MASADTTNALRIAAASGESVVIVGAGLAGLFTALKLSPHPVVLISPAPLGEGTSSGWLVCSYLTLVRFHNYRIKVGMEDI